MKFLLIFFMVMAIAGCGGESKTPDSTHNNNTTQNNSDLQTNKDQQKGIDTTLSKNTELNKTGNDQTSTSKQGELKNKTGENTHTQTESQNDNNNEVTLADNKLNDNSGSGSFIDNGDKASVYIGIFARWNLKDGSQFDGSYDTVHSLFYLCQTKVLKAVPRKEVIFQPFASCDEVKKSIMLMRKISKNNYQIYPGEIKLQGTKGIIKNGNEIRTIQFTPATINRINKTTLYQKNDNFHIVPTQKPPQKIAPNFQNNLIKEKTPVERNTQILQPQNTIVSGKNAQQPVQKMEVKTLPAETKLQPQPPVINKDKLINTTPQVVQPKTETKTVKSTTEMKIPTTSFHKVIMDTPKPATKMRMAGKTFQKNN